MNEASTPPPAPPLSSSSTMERSHPHNNGVSPSKTPPFYSPLHSMWNNSSRSFSPGSNFGYPGPPGILDMKKAMEGNHNGDLRPQTPAVSETTLWPNFDPSKEDAGYFGLVGGPSGNLSSRKLPPPEGNDIPSEGGYYHPSPDTMMDSLPNPTQSSSAVTTTNISSMPYPYFTSPATDLTSSSLYAYSSCSTPTNVVTTGSTKTVSTTGNRFRSKGRNIMGKMAT